MLISFGAFRKLQYTDGQEFLLEKPLVQKSTLIFCLSRALFVFCRLLFFMKFLCSPECHFVSTIRILDYSLDDDKIRSQDTITVISQLAINSKAWRMTWNFVRHNWKILYKRYRLIVDLQVM